MACKLIKGKTEEEQRQLCLNCPFPQCVHDNEKATVHHEPKVLKKGDPSISRVSEKEGDMNSIKERHRYYEANKEAMIADLLSQGRSATRKKWNITSSSLHTLESRWLSKEQKLKIPSNPGRPAKPPHPSTNSTPSNGRLPPFPQFSDTWDPSVQLQWLEVYSELAKRETTLATTP